MNVRSIVLVTALGTVSVLLGLAVGRRVGSEHRRPLPAPRMAGTAIPSPTGERPAASGEVSSKQSGERPVTVAPGVGDTPDEPEAGDPLGQWLAGAGEAGPHWQAFAKEIAALRRDEGSDDGALAAFRARLDGVWVELRGKFPTAVPDGKGEFTHPKLLATLVDRVLSTARIPLDAGQRNEILRLGREYDETYGLATSSYDDDTPRLARIVDEIALKQAFVDGLLEELEPRQRSALEEYLVLDEPIGDLLSPLRIAEVRFREIVLEDLPHFRAEFGADLADDIGISSGEATRITEIIFGDLAPLLDSRALLDLDRVERALTAGAALARGVEEILRLPELDAAVRRRLLERSDWFVPHVAAE